MASSRAASRCGAGFAGDAAGALRLRTRHPQHLNRLLHASNSATATPSADATLSNDSSVGFALLLSIELIRAWRTPASFAKSCCDHDFLCRSRRTFRARSCLVCPEFRLAIDQDDAFRRKRVDTF
jgi:hypothetical protein